MTNVEIIQEEFDNLKDEIIEAYEKSGKKVSGEFARGLSVKVEGVSNITAKLMGYEYLAGRGAGKQPPLEPLIYWVKNKGIFGNPSDSVARGIAYVIARKIATKGTNPIYHLKVYNQVITKQRIASIIDRLTTENKKNIVDNIKFELKSKK